MTSSSNSAPLYREAVRQTFIGYKPEPDTEEYFRTFLEQRYTLVKSDLAHRPEEKVSSHYVNSDRLALFIIAVGLLTYGRLDVLSDILDNVPPSDLPLYRLLGVFRAVLPLPATLSIRTHLDGIRDWVAEHEGYLEWDSETTKFTLRY